MATTFVVYLHGFRSSPRSSKAVMTAVAVNSASNGGNLFKWFCPQLLASPKESMDLVVQRIETSSFDRLVVIGSSLGGFYANYLAEKYDCKAVVLNPAVRAPKELAPHVGMMTSYDSDEPFDFRLEYIDQLQALQVEKITDPQRYFLIAAKGDELLDWREMVEFYKGSKQLVLEGSDHGIADYADHLPEVMSFISS
ncbi:YqiA/YcfP family alpha/beta fold hydrolase [Polynucleobacter necessarius]|uniref:YqiA/YcfP family alpha/beta fold hydrolase n=1 Tax=Polynucleobacter necessarius TaxID=576610 RepID=UPI000FE1DDDF|nr:YqiA/YcfP family alpha/beta fold hydrolase [Polynucleobacter necessarius]